MQRLRKTLFWVHLAFGLVASATIAITAFTGLCMSFEKQLLAWAERDLRVVSQPSPNTERLRLDDLFQRIQHTQTNAEPTRRREPDAVGERPASPGPRSRRPTSWTLSSNPNEAIVVTFGRTNVLYANPYTGEVIPQGSLALRSFFRTMITWHRWLGTSERVGSDDSPRRQGMQDNPRREANPTNPDSTSASALFDSPRKIAATVVGCSAGVLLFLSISGLILWWPRVLSAKAFASSTRIHPNLRGRARDWNWHNAFGFWAAPFLVIMSLTGLAMAFRDFGDLLYGPPSRPAVSPASVPASNPTESSSRRTESSLGPDAILKSIIQQVPDWDSITVRSSQGRPRSGGSGGGGGGGGSQPITALVKPSGSWSPMPRQLLLDPTTGALIQPDPAISPSWRQSLRRWNRTIHTGEAGGFAGQLAAALGCLSALMLIYTGLALSLRRLRNLWANRPALGRTPEV